jgi:uncharacterized membrane protein YkoI
MTRLFATRIHRPRRPSIVVLAAISLGVWVLFLNPVASSAAPTSSYAVDIGAATAGLEALHQRAVARTQADDDDKSQVSWGHVITPEQAATLAQQVARARGDATMHPSYIELQIRNGRPVYAVRIGTGPAYIDADTGAVVP